MIVFDDSFVMFEDFLLIYDLVKDFFIIFRIFECFIIIITKLLFVDFLFFYFMVLL